MAVFRKFNDSDAENIISAVRDTYGEEYTPKFMYDQNYLCKASSSGEIIFTVAETESGEFIGIIGLKLSKRILGAIEVIALVVKKKFRELHIGFKLFEYCMSVADSLKLPSIYGTAVMINDFSQRIVAKLGFKATGFWLNRKCFSDKLKSGNRYKNDKISMLVVVRNFGVEDVGDIFLPKRYQDRAYDCYSQFGITFKVCEERIEPTVDETIFSESGEEDFYNKNIFIYDAGKDFLSLIKKASVLENSLSTISVILDIKMKSSVWCVEELEKLGYKFTGFLPLASGHEYIIFHLSRCNIETEEFVLNKQFEFIKKVGL